MKKEVYDTEEYEEKIKKLQTFDGTIKKFDNLKNLSDLLFYTVLISLITALLQFTLGLVQHELASLIYISFALSNMYLLIFGISQMKSNLDYIYNFK